MADPQPKTPRELMEDAARELETEALKKRYAAGGDPLTPVKSEDDVARERELRGPEHEIPPEHQVPPNEVIEQEKLGVK